MPLFKNDFIIRLSAFISGVFCFSHICYSAFQSAGIPGILNASKVLGEMFRLFREWWRVCLWLGGQVAHLVGSGLYCLLWDLGRASSLCGPRVSIRTWALTKTYLMGLQRALSAMKCLSLSSVVNSKSSKYQRQPFTCAAHHAFNVPVGNWVTLRLRPCAVVILVC